jgi:hypothetical protein
VGALLGIVFALTHMDSVILSCGLLRYPLFEHAHTVYARAVAMFGIPTASIGVAIFAVLVFNEAIVMGRPAIFDCDFFALVGMTAFTLYGLLGFFRGD